MKYIYYFYYCTFIYWDAFEANKAAIAAVFGGGVTAFNISDIDDMGGPASRVTRFPPELNCMYEPC